MLPVADQPRLQTASGDEAATMSSAPCTATLPKGDGILLSGSVVILNTRTRRRMRAEKAIHRGAATCGQMQPQKVVSNDRDTGPPQQRDDWDERPYRPRHNPTAASSRPSQGRACSAAATVVNVSRP